MSRKCHKENKFSTRCVRLTRRVGKPEGLYVVAPLLDPSDPLEGRDVNPESASSIDLGNEKDIGHGDRSSDTIAVVANKPFDGCPYRKSNPNVLVMQSAEMWLCEDPADTLNFARNRRVLVQRQMRAGFVVICHVRSQQVPKVTLAKDNDMVEHLSPDRTNQPSA
jgi:hypothetical protein